MRHDLESDDTDYADYESDNDGIANKIVEEIFQVEVRNYFPETWLFDLVELDEQGSASLDLEAPHTVTTWVGDVVCAHPDAGLAVSDRAELLVKQDFFADILMPYSVKRGEILPVNVSVFNSVEDRSLPIRLSVVDSDALKVDPMSEDVCVEGGDNDIRTFTVRAKELGEVNVTVRAMITDEAGGGEEGGCSPAEEAEGFTDVLQKSILVKPEGFPVEKVETKFQCLGEDEEEDPEITLDALSLPEDLVKDSERAWVTVTGDIMAPSISNLGRFVRQPTGCGEQTMVSLAPNVYLLDYLRGTGQSKPELESKAKAHITRGYNREQKFRHSDGSYSVWGPQDKVGSMWLTSFVVKVFSQAAGFVDTVSRRSLEQSVNFVLSNQLKDGCFRNMGFVYNSDLRGTDSSITASALVTLLEASSVVKVEPSVFTEAVECIRRNTSTTDDLYGKSLAAYAFSLYNERRADISEELEELEDAEEMLEGLLSAANTTKPGQLFWWEADYESASRAVEITAYNVLSLTLQKKLPEALQAIKWLTGRRNSYGGFYSTQDTVVALQALSLYSKTVGSTERDLTVTVKEKIGGDEHEFALDEDNKLLLQRDYVSDVSDGAGFDVSATGKGCFMVQTVLRYNVHNAPEQEAFEAKATLSKEGDRLEVCATYVGPKERTNMAVIEVEMLSGYRATEEGLAELEKAPGVRMVESDEEESPQVVLYFDSFEMGRTGCWEVPVVKTVAVEELRPAIVRVYDYYRTEDSLSVEYNEGAE